MDSKTSEYLKPIKKSDIKQAKSYVYNKIPLNELTLLQDEHDNKKTREAKMSTFTNAHSAKDGDFFTYNKDGEIVYGKIINSKIGKSIV